jgi:putative membrane protein
MSKLCFAFAVLIAFAGASTLRAAGAPKADADAKVAAGDTKFVTNAAAGGQMEVDLGKLAAEKGASDDVKHFGQQMVDDHTKANEELKHLAMSKHIDLTKAMESAAKKSEKASDKLSKLAGHEFDNAYIKEMVKDHEKDVKDFEKESEHGEDAEIKAFAAKTLPTLHHHLEMAKQMQEKHAKQ